MTNEQLDRIEATLRAEHHSEVRWVHNTCAILLAEMRANNERIAALENAIRKVIKHQPWPGDDRSERDFIDAAMLVPEEF